MLKDRSSICLHLVLTDYAPFVGRTLDSVRRWIDCWVILDAGSSDETRQLVRQYLRDLPGQFARDQREALSWANGHADYVLVMQAGEVIGAAGEFHLPPLTAQCYGFSARPATFTPRSQLLRTPVEPERHPVSDDRQPLTGIWSAPALDVLPRVSCLMVTLDRLALARRAIRSYADQTYPHRELVVVSDGEPGFRAALQHFVEKEQIPNVRFVHPGAENLPIGQLRNISIEAACGPVVCQWDDDDVSYPTRLALQMEFMLHQNSRACFLADHLQFIGDSGLFCWVDWTKGGASQGASQIAPGTAMMYKDVPVRYPETGPHARQGEDSVLLFRIYEMVPVAILARCGYLYLYQYHGRNTYSLEHHFRLSRCRTPIKWLQQYETKLRQAVDYYGLPRPLVVTGLEGPAFTIS